MDRAPIFSYVKSRGMYAGIEIMGQVFVERYDENGTFYAWTGVKAGDIVSLHTSFVKGPSGLVRCTVENLVGDRMDGSAIVGTERSGRCTVQGGK